MLKSYFQYELFIEENFPIRNNCRIFAAGKVGSRLGVATTRPKDIQDKKEAFLLYHFRQNIVLMPFFLPAHH